MKLYHVSYLYNLPSIQGGGLTPGAGQVFGGGYGGHSRNRLFLTDWDGVEFWVQRYGELAEHHTDNPEEDWVPIVFQVDATGLELHPDEPGTQDSRSDSHYVTEVLEPERILAVWDGSDWVDLDDADMHAMSRISLDAAEKEKEDDVTLYYMDFDVFRPDEEPS